MKKRHGAFAEGGPVKIADGVSSYADVKNDSPAEGMNMRNGKEKNWQESGY